MSGKPWEKFGSAPPPAAAKPWEKFGGESQAQEPVEPSMLENAGDAAKAGAENFSNMALAGYAPQIAGAATAGIGLGKDALEGTAPSLDALKAYYGQGKDDALETLKRDTEKSPISSYAGMAGGAIGSPLNTMLAPFKAAQGAGVAAKLGAAAKNGALLGAAYNPGDTKDSGVLQLGERASNAAVGGIGGAAVDGALRAAAPLAKKTMFTLLGPSEEGINKYLTRRDQINKAPTLATMKDTIDEQVRTMRTRVQLGELSVGQAELELAKQQQALKSGLEGIDHPRVISDDVHSAVASLKGQVVNEAGVARDILEKSGDKISLKPLKAQLVEARNALMVDGNMPITEGARASVEKLSALKKSLDNYGPELSGGAAKTLMKHLDDEVDFIREAGGFGDAYGQAIKATRRAIDEQLKQNPDYSKQMQSLARKTGILDKANDLFGTREKAFSSMGSMAGENRVPQRDLLKSLEQETGQKFSPTVDNYMAAQAALKKQLPELNKQLPANADLDRLKQDLLRANESAAPFKGWGPASTQNKLQSQISRSKDRASIEADRELRLLDQARPEGEPSYLQSIDDNRVRSEFSSDRTRGSRNALIWRGIGAGVGGMIGHALPGAHLPTALLGGATGGVVGGYIDKKGGEIAKSALDHYLNNQATYEAIRRTNPNTVINPWLGMGMKK